MKKTITIEGMSCAHCQKRVEDALNAIGGGSAKVNLKKKTADIPAEVKRRTEARESFFGRNVLENGRCGRRFDGRGEKRGI